MLEYEHKYAALGKKFIAGADEAGRGPLAGPVCVAAVILPTDTLIEGVNDSKKLSEKKRESLYAQIVQRATAFQVVFIDNDTIDRINILEATRLGFKRALEGLAVRPDVALIDAVTGIDTDVECVPIIRGDAVSYSIAAASILAKVSRDRLMARLDAEYPAYGFAAHKGYGTAAHVAAIRRYGLSPVHRKSFRLKELSDDERS